MGTRPAWTEEEDEVLREELDGCVVSKDAGQKKADVDEG